MNNKETNEPIGIQRIIGQKMTIAKETDVCYETICDVSCDKKGNVTILFSNGNREMFPIEMLEGMMCGCHYICFIKKEAPIDDNTTTSKGCQTKISIDYSLPDFYNDVYLPDTAIGTAGKFYNDRMRVWLLSGLIGKKMIIQNNDEKPIVAKIIKINKSHDELYFTFLNGEKKFENPIPFYFSSIRVDYSVSFNEYLDYRDEYGIEHQVKFSLYNTPLHSTEEWEERKWNLATALFVARNNTIDINCAIAIADEFIEKWNYPLTACFRNRFEK